MKSCKLKGNVMIGYTVATACDLAREENKNRTKVLAAG